MRRPCEGAWRDILEWAWHNKVDEFTHNDLLDKGVVGYRGDGRQRVWSASATLRHMLKAGLLTRLATGKGRRASLYAPISRAEYKRKLKRLVLV